MARKGNSVWLGVAVAAALALCPRAGCIARAEDWDGAARLLAGMPGPGFASARSGRGWAEHAAEMEKAWSRFEGGRLAKIRAWSSAEMGDIHGRCRTVFYPFSGPDLAHAVAFFPKAERYVLCALEPAEPLPDLGAMSGGDWSVSLAAMRAPMLTAINYTYFITKDMRRDFGRGQLKGNLPPLLAFAARLGLRVEAVEPVGVGGDGAAVVREGWAGPPPRGIRLRLRGGGGEKEVFYFSADLGDGALGKDNWPSRLLAGMGTRVTFMKSASYLMHESYFSRVRSVVLDGSVAILQDDSGIPLSGFDPWRWDLRFYGNYRGTLDMFRQYFQPGLRGIFERADSRVRPLSFGVGYKFKPEETVLILARGRAGDAPPRAERVR